MEITWKRTVIGGETAPGDFVAEAEGQLIGRVMKTGGGPQNGKWQWSFQLGHGDFRYGHMNGVEESKQQAADQIKAAFAYYLEHPGTCEGVAVLPAHQQRLAPYGFDPQYRMTARLS